MTYESVEGGPAGTARSPWDEGIGRLGAVLLAAVLLLASGCGDGSAGPDAAATVDRDTFVAAYVDLRLAALANETGTITPPERERILERHGVSGEDLLRFVEVHGDRIEFMREVWNDVDDRIRAAAARGDTTSS